MNFDKSPARIRRSGLGVRRVSRSRGPSTRSSHLGRPVLCHAHLRRTRFSGKLSVLICIFAEQSGSRYSQNHREMQSVRQVHEVSEACNCLENVIVWINYVLTESFCEKSIVSIQPSSYHATVVPLLPLLPVTTMFLYFTLQFVILETLISAVNDELKETREKRKIITVTAVCLVTCLIGLVFCTRVGCLHFRICIYSNDHLRNHGRNRNVRFYALKISILHEGFRYWWSSGTTQWISLLSKIFLIVFIFNRFLQQLSPFLFVQRNWLR